MKWSSLLLLTLIATSVSAKQSQSSQLSWKILEQEISLHTSQPSALHRYHAHKAKMWLSYAKNEASEGSLTVAGKEAILQSQMLIKGLNQASSLSLTTPIVSVSQVMRRDVWWQLEYLKQHGGIDAAPQALAEAEVMLVWAAAEYCELGWRHAREHFLAVERRLDAVKQAVGPLPEMHMAWLSTHLPALNELNVSQCQGVHLAKWPLIVPAAAPVLEEVQVVEVQPPVDPVPEDIMLEEELIIENVVHFALDRAELSAEGRKVLDQIVQLLNARKDLVITLRGYTDMRASVAYNLRLSQRRIHTVRKYLVAQGVDGTRIAEEAKGKSELIIDQEQRIGHAKSRRVVVYFHDSEGKSIRVKPQWRDLQLESEKGIAR